MAKARKGSRRAATDAQDTDPPSVTVSVRLTPEQRERLKDRAEAAGMEPGRFLRRLILHDLKQVDSEGEPTSPSPALARDLEQIRNSVDLLRTDLGKMDRVLRELRNDVATALLGVLRLHGFDDEKAAQVIAEAFPSEA